jgi:TP901 family phage tail tape measure protein
MLGNVRLAFAAVAVAAAGMLPVKLAADYETALVGVIKTTSLAGVELQKFEDGVSRVQREFAVSKIEMLGLAEAAGQMKVSGADNLVNVAHTMAKLAKSSDVVGEEGLKSIVRILNVTGESIGTISNFASAVVAVGQASAASEAEILHMTLAFAGATKGFGVSSAELVGIGSALKSLGQKAEGAASTISRTFTEISSAIQLGGEPAAKMAAHLGLSVDEMRDQFKKSASDTLLLFLSRLKEKGDAAIITLKDLGLASTEDSRNLRVLAGAHEEVAEAINLATNEHRKNIALNKEAAAANATFASQAIIFKNNLIAIATAIGQFVLPALTSILKEINFVFNSGEKKMEMFTLFARAKFEDIELLAKKAADGITFAFSEAFDTILDYLEGRLSSGFRDLLTQMTAAISFIKKAKSLLDIPDARKIYDDAYDKQVDRLMNSGNSGSVKSPNIAPDIIPRIKYQRKDFGGAGDKNIYQERLDKLMEEAKVAKVEHDKKMSDLFGADGFPKNDAAIKAINDALAKAKKEASNGLPTGNGTIDNSLFGGTGISDRLDAEALAAENLAAQLSDGLRQTEDALTAIQTAAVQHRDELQALGRDTWSGFFDTLEDFARTGRLDFKNFANDIILQLAKVQIKALATRAILGLANAGGATGSIFGAVAGAFGLGARAEGGSVGSGGAFMVGEMGPEVFVPKRNGTIVPNDYLSGGGGSGSPSVILQQENNYNGGASAADLVEFSKRTTANSVRAITEIISNGGQPARQFAQ